MNSLRICIDVPDVERALDFYQRALGWTVGRRFDAAWVEMLGAPVPVDLLGKGVGTRPAPGTSDERRYARHWTPVHFDLVVEDIDDAVRRAQAAGATLEGDVKTHRYGRLAVLGDPFGHGFCFLEFKGRGYDELVG